MLDFLFVEWFITPGFIELEERDSFDNVIRCVEMLDRELFHLKAFVSDWAVWDDTYRFIADSNKEFIESNLGFNTFENNKISIIALKDKKSRIIWQAAYDLEEERETSFREVNDFLLKLPVPETIEESFATLINTEKGIMLVAVSAILNSDGSGPSRGIILMAKLLNDEYLDLLNTQIKLDFSVELLNPHEFGAGLIKRSYDDNTVFYDKSKPDTIKTFIINEYPKIEQKYLFTVSNSRDLMNSGKKTSFVILVSFFLIGIITLFFLAINLNALIIRPLYRLKEHTVEVARTEILQEKLYANRNDEIGVLAHEFDQTLEKLITVREKLIEMSYVYGSSEMAGSILHNIRNSTSSYINQISLINDIFVSMDTRNPQKALDEIIANPNSENKEKYLKYLKLFIQNVTKGYDDYNKIKENLNKLESEIESFLMETDKLSQQKPIYEKIHFEKFFFEVNSLLNNKMEIENKPDSAVIILPKITVLNAITTIRNFFVNIYDARIDSAKMSCDEESVEIKIKYEKINISDEEINLLFTRDYKIEKSGMRSNLHWTANSLNTIAGRLSVSRCDDCLVLSIFFTVEIFKQ